jgi:hypothetical protein
VIYISPIGALFASPLVALSGAAVAAERPAQSSAGQVFSMMRAPLRRVILASGQRLTAAWKVANASARSFTPVASFCFA